MIIIMFQLKKVVTEPAKVGQVHISTQEKRQILNLLWVLSLKHLIYCLIGGPNHDKVMGQTFLDAVDKRTQLRRRL